MLNEFLISNGDYNESYIHIYLEVVQYILFILNETPKYCSRYEPFVIVFLFYISKKLNTAMYLGVYDVIIIYY